MDKSGSLAEYVPDAHQITIEGQRHARITGVVDVESFHEQEAAILTEAGMLILSGEELKLTSMEYKLLCLLARNTGKVLTHTFITQNIWGRNWDSDIASLRVFMTTLRKKIEPGPDSPKYIQTHIGIGYRMLKVD